MTIANGLEVSTLYFPDKDASLLWTFFPETPAGRLLKPELRRSFLKGSEST
ncbi:MAG: hypothetical protein V1793_03840 [Pseudomonadota bacterium]